MGEFTPRPEGEILIPAEVPESVSVPSKRTVSPDVVNRFVSMFGERAGGSTDPLEIINSLRQAGVSQRSIAGEMGLHPSEITRMARQVGARKDQGANREITRRAFPLTRARKAIRKLPTR